MSDDAELLSGATILRRLREVAELIDDDAQHTIVLVGGSLLAVRGLRDSTRDADSVESLSPVVLTAARAVAARHDMASTWLNDRAAMFRPAGLHADECTPVLETSRLLVLEPPLRYVFAMKLFAARATDVADLRRLWPHAGFRTAADAITFYEACYPIAEPDRYLADFLTEHVMNEDPD